MKINGSFVFGQYLEFVHDSCRSQLMKFKCMTSSFEWRRKGTSSTQRSSICSAEPKQQRRAERTTCTTSTSTSPKTTEWSYPSDSTRSKLTARSWCSFAESVQKLMVELGKYKFTRDDDDDDIARMRAGNAGNEYANEKYLGHYYNPLKESDTPPNGGSNEQWTFSNVMSRHVMSCHVMDDEEVVYK